MEIAALNMARNNGELQQIGLARISHAVMARLWGGSENLKHYFSLRNENDRLALQVSELNTELIELRRIAGSDAESSQDGAFIYTPARIVKMSRNRQHNYFIIDKGSNDGILPQSGIITPEGAVGIIDAVEQNYSFGLSFFNVNVSVSARIGRDGTVGPLAWDGTDKGVALLKEIPLQCKFELGDTVWTSGFSSIFPPDIPLGTVCGSKIINGAVYNISVDLFEDYSSLRYVTVTANADRDEIVRLEQLEEGLEDE